MRLNTASAATALLLTTAACGDGRTAVPPVPPPFATPSVAPIKPGTSFRAETTGVVEHGPPSKKLVALTFDADLTAAMLDRLIDGTVTTYYDSALIETLRELDVPATLFLTGLWMQEYPDVVRELARDELVELGTHSMTHGAFTDDCPGLASVPPARMLPEVAGAVEVLDDLDPDATRWFRFPGGCHDRDARTRTVAAGVTAVGLGVDVGRARSAQEAVDTVLREVGPGAIVTLPMHGGRFGFARDAVETLVPELRARGYEPVTITDLMAGRSATTDTRTTSPAIVGGAG